MSLELGDQDVKYIVNHRGKPCAVQMSFKKFKAMQKELARLTWFECSEVQEDLRRSEQDLKKGKVFRAKGSNIDKAISWLNETD
jgi:hypothetical protein